MARPPTTSRRGNTRTDSPVLYLRSVPRNRGRRKTTWIDVIRMDFYSNDSAMIEDLSVKSKDRNQWRKLVNYIMLNTTNMLR